MKIFLGALLLATSLSAAADSYDMLIMPGGRTMYIPSFRTYIATGYVPSEKNVELLKQVKAKSPSLKLVSFDAKANDASVLYCRASFPVYAPNKTPFASLVEAAFNMEITGAGLSTPDAPRIQARLDEFDFSSAGTGKWTIGATFFMDGKEPLAVKNEYTYPVSFGAAAACRDVMNALTTGLESFLYKVYSDPRFAEFSQ